MPSPVETIVAKLRGGQPAAAAKLARVQVKKNPNSPLLAKLYGIALHDSGKHREAVAQLNRATRLAPKDIEVKRYLVGSLLAIGQAAKAQQALEGWLRSTPNDPELAYLLAGTLVQLEQFDKAIEAADACLASNPRKFQAKALRGLARFEQAEFVMALADFQAASEADPANTEYLLNIGSTLNELHRFDQARTVFERAVKLAPDNTELLTNLATIDMRQGRFFEAKQTFRKILSLNPGDVESMLQLTELADGGDTQEVANLLEKAERAAGNDKDQTAIVLLSRGKHLLSSGQPAEAMQAFETSNRLRAQTAPYDPAAAKRKFERITSFFSGIGAKQLIPVTNPPSTARPIFVIGLPRSGTTLTELVLSAHTDVVGLGELRAVADKAEEVLGGRITDASDIARSYMKFVPEIALNGAAFVDKMPGNYHYLGLLAQAFPAARFINVQRDPREVALSMWQVHLKGDETTYTSRMDWIAHAANLYRRYMAFWQGLCGEKIMTLPYRDLVSDLEGSSRAMAAFCGLDWQPAMLEPERNKANVATASITQARQKVHTRSIGKWRDYPALMQPLVDALDPALWPEFDL